MSVFAINLDFTSLLVILCPLTLLLWWSFRDSEIIKFLKTQRGPRLFPIIGNALEFQHPAEILTTLASYPPKYGNRVRIILGNYGTLGLVHPDDLEKIFSCSTQTAKADIYKFLIPWLGNGLLISSGPKWRERRKFYSPIFFHHKVLETFKIVFNEQAKVLVDILKEKVQRGESTIPMHGMFMKITLDIICETGFGKKLNSQREPYHPYADAIARESEYLFKRIVSPWLHPDLIFKYSPLGRKEAKNLKYMRSFVAEVIKERRLINKGSFLKITEEDFIYRSNNRKFCVLDAFIQEQENGNEEYNDVMIRDEVNSLIFGGHDTTASNLIWNLFLITTNPGVQDSIHEELDSVFGTDKDRPVTSSDLANLKYLECCIKESLRLYPPTPITGRNLEHDIKLDDGVVLPKGLEILISVHVTQRLAEFYPDPLEFKPSRWTPENCKGRHPYAFFPFSAGVKNCMGIKYAYAENKTILAFIFRNFHVECVDDPSTVIIDPEIVIRPKGDIRFKFTPRA